MMDVEREDGLGMDLEMSRPSGFFRDIPPGFGALNGDGGSCGRGLDDDSIVERDDVGVVGP